MVSPKRLYHHLLWELEKLSLRRAIRAGDPKRRGELPQGPVLFLTAEASVRPHFGAQCLIARTLKELGHPVLFVRCLGTYARCPVMDMHSLAYPPTRARREQVCYACARDSLRTLGEYGLDAVPLEDYMTRDIRAEAEAAIEGAPKDLREFTYRDIPFGKISVMSLVVARKVSRLSDVRGVDRTAWLTYIQNSILSFLLTDRLIERLKPSVIVQYNDDAGMIASRLAAEKRGVRVLTVAHSFHRSNDRRKLVIVPWVGVTALNHVRRGWDSWAPLSLGEAEIREVGEDLIDHFKGQGSHHYSPEKTMRTDQLFDQLNLSPDRKTIVAYTASLDEFLAIQMVLEGVGQPLKRPPEPFADQIAWLEALTTFVEESSDLQLVIRVHPREGADKRNRSTSEHLELLKRHFDRPFRHCRIVWPADPTSSYDLAELAHAVTTSWSNIGLELARLGCGLVASGFGVGAHADGAFREWGATPDEYFAKLRALVDRQDRGMNPVIQAFRWHHYAATAYTADVADVVPTPRLYEVPQFRMPATARLIEAAIVRDQSLPELNRERLAARQDEGAARREREAVAFQLRRILRYLFTLKDEADDFHLVVAEGPGEVPPPGGSGEAVVAVVGDSVTWHAGEDRVTKRSPLCARLAVLCCHERIAARAPTGGKAAASAAR